MTDNIVLTLTERLLCYRQASLNLGTPALANAYNAVRTGDAAWVVYTLTATNELKVEETGDSSATLDDMQEEFSDGK